MRIELTPKLIDMTTKEIALTICKKIQKEYPKRPLWQTMLDIEALIDTHVKEQLSLFGVVRQSEQLKVKYTEEFKDWMTENGWYEPVNLTFFNKDGSTRFKEDLYLEYKKYKDSL